MNTDERDKQQVQNPNYNPNQSPTQQNRPDLHYKPKRRLFPRIFWTVFIIILIAFSVLFVKAYNLSSKIFVSRHSFFRTLADLLFHRNDIQLQGEDNGAVNILLLGYGGQGHDGAYLTDTIMLASIDVNNKMVLLTSIPRDYYYPQGISSKKINEAYVDGSKNNTDPADGGSQAEQVFGELSGQIIPYFAAIDFTGFEKAVDKLGGLDVNIERTFTDTLFPNDATNGYLPPITFTKGMQHMNGMRALEFARSRHAAGPEGSDFARSRRQHQILEAFKQKAYQLNIATDTGTINDLLNIFADHFKTNLQPNELAHLAAVLKDPGLKVVSQSLDPDTGLVCDHTLDDGQYVVIPCDGVTEQNIHDFFKNGFQLALVRSEQPAVILENSGNNSQLYRSAKRALQLAGATIYEVPYRGIPLAKSVLYEVNSKPLTEQYIENLLNIKRQQKPQEMTANADMVLIIGQ